MDLASVFSPIGLLGAQYLKHFKASSLHFGRCHFLSFLEPEVTIFGREGGAEQMLIYHLMLNRDANFG